MKKKTNSELAEAIYLAKKSNLLELAKEISVSTRQQARINIGRINEIKEKVVIVPGKVLSLGEINEKKDVYALGFSKIAEDKLKKAGCRARKILDALRKGEKLNGVILK